MAININTILTTEAGIPIPVNTMLKPKVSFGSDILNRDEDGDYDGTYVRIMKADLGWLYASKAAYQADEYNIIGIIQDFEPTYTKVMSEQDYTDLMADGSLAEQWILADLNDILGVGICTLVDPFTI